jgi:hypothetical protein
MRVNRGALVIYLRRSQESAGRESAGRHELIDTGTNAIHAPQ